MKVRIKDSSVFPALTIYEYKFDKTNWVECTMTKEALFPIIKHLDFLEVEAPVVIKEKKVTITKEEKLPPEEVKTEVISEEVTPLEIKKENIDE